MRQFFRKRRFNSLKHLIPALLALATSCVDPGDMAREAETAHHISSLNDTEPSSIDDLQDPSTEHRSLGLCPENRFGPYQSSEQVHCLCPPGQILTFGQIMSKRHDAQGNLNERPTAFLIAECGDQDCPVGRFDTRVHRGCKCPDGETKHYQGLFDTNAYCTGSPCPEGNFRTTGANRGCACPEGSAKKYQGLGNAKAYCEGHNPCPSGVFSTTQHRGCNCPENRAKRYRGIGDSRAFCEGQNSCPSGKFSTNKHRSCSCPPGQEKRYSGLFNSRGRCVDRAPSGGGSGPVPDPPNDPPME